MSIRLLFLLLAHNSDNGIVSTVSNVSQVTSQPQSQSPHQSPISLVSQASLQQSQLIPSITAQTSHILQHQQSQIYNNEVELTMSIPAVSPRSSVSSQSSPIPPGSCSPTLPNTNSHITKISDGMSTLKSIAQQVIVQSGLQLPSSESSRNIFESSKTNIIINNCNSTTAEAHIPPLLGVAPLGPVPLLKEHQHQFQMMEAAYYHMPHPSDSERLRPYLPRNSIPTPPYYQQVS